MFGRKLLPPSQKAARETEDTDIWKSGKKLGLQTTRWEMVDLKDVTYYMLLITLRGTFVQQLGLLAMLVSLHPSLSLYFFFTSLSLLFRWW
jgi:hypothetical protein